MTNREVSNDKNTILIETNDYITTAYGSLHYYRCDKCDKCDNDELLDCVNYCSNCGRKVIDKYDK